MNNKFSSCFDAIFKKKISQILIWVEMERGRMEYTSFEILEWKVKKYIFGAF